jgi:O-antigen/teichoic acid export membrane protein
VFSTTRELPVISTIEMPAITDVEGSNSKVVKALRNPLYRSGYALVINTAGTTALGAVYWAIAARLYNQQTLGRSSALISALLLLSTLAQLNLGNALVRFLPQSGRSASGLIRASYGASAVAALVGAVGFVLILPRTSSAWKFLSQSWPLCLAFIAAALIWGVFTLEDAALTGLRRAVVVPIENTAYGVLKLALLVVFAWALRSSGIFISWILPLIPIILVINWMIFRRYAGEVPPSDVRLRTREIVRFAGVDYLGSLLSQAYGSILPLIVLSVLGAAANGSFYIAWTISSGLMLVAANFGTSLMVEAMSAPERLGELTKGVLARCAAVVLAGTAVLVVGARPILDIYGAKYAAHASVLLIVLALATLPRSLVQLTFALDRIAGKVGRASFTQFVLAVLVLSAASVMMRPLGILGVGLAWTGANVLVAVVRLPTIINATRQRPWMAPSAAGHPEMPGRHRGSHRRGAGPAPALPAPSVTAPAGTGRASGAAPRPGKRAGSGRHRVETR